MSSKLSKLISWLHRGRAEEGQAMVMVALSLVVMLGFGAFAVDIGHVAVVKSDLQNAADAAALAGAAELSSSSASKVPAENMAITYAKDNGMGVQTNGVALNGEKVIATANTTTKQVRVECSQTVDYYFAGVLGVDSKEVTAVAVAKRDSNLPSAFTDYAILSESETVDLAVGKAGQSTCIGTIHTNKKLILGTHLDLSRAEAFSGITQTGANVIGTSDAASPKVNIPADFIAALKAQAELAPIKYTVNKTFSGNGLDLNQSVYVKGTVRITGNNLTGKGFIYATGNITIDGNKTQIGTAAEPVFICSETGNVTIVANSPNLYCVVYAPKGTINVTKNNWNLHGRLIAKQFNSLCLKNGFTIEAGSGDFGGVPLGDGEVKLIL